MRGRSPVARDLFSAGIRFIVDGMLVPLSVIAGASWRFETLFPTKLPSYIAAMVVGALVLPSLTYIGGLYSAASARLENWVRVRWFLFNLAVTILLLLAIGSVSLEARVGRGVLMYGVFILALLYFVHHFLLPIHFGNARMRVACLVSSADDELAAEILSQSSPQIEVVGLIAVSEKFQPSMDLPLLAKLDEIEHMKLPASVNTILVRDQHLVMPSLTTLLRRWRYQGMDIMSLADACETVLHAVPLPLVTESWLFRASNQSGLLYIKKLKRLFDVSVAILCLLTLWPALLIGILIVRLSSAGPVFFRQTRMGRLGREFVIYKLRTMRLDAEKNGPQWSSSGKDDRVFPAGAFLRRYRIDEIPQLFNILKGDMSFVGPRPERPEFINQLEKEIPFYLERLLVQPGLTGWAQVRYPYGSNIEDAWRKHELDLYYIKHMSLLLDFFVLLETTRTVLLGGNRKPDAYIKAMHQWNVLESAADAPTQIALSALQPAMTKP